MLPLLSGCEAKKADLETPVAAIRQPISRCGGSIECDGQGRPIAVDLAAERGSADRAAFGAAVGCRSLQRLRLNAGQLSANDLAKIPLLCGLKELALQDAPINDDFLARLSRSCPLLERLTLRNALAVSDRGIAELGGLAHLAQVALLDLKIGGPAIEALAKNPSLVSLDLRMSSNIKAPQLRALAAAASLKELKLGGYAIDNAAIEVLAGLPHLESLTVEDASISGEGLAKFLVAKAVAPRIRSLALARCSALNDEALAAIGHLPNLHRLALRDLPVTGSFLRKLPSPEKLEMLTLHQTYLADEAFEAIAAFRNLSYLDLGQNVLTLAAMEKIATLERLESLNLAECGLNDDLLQPLAKLNHLKELAVEGNPDVTREKALRLVGRP